MDDRRRRTEEGKRAEDKLGIRPLGRRELKVIKAGDPLPGNTSSNSPTKEGGCFCVCAQPVGEMC